MFIKFYFILGSNTQGGYFSSRESNLNYIDDSPSKIIDLKKAHLKIREMEECLKTMNEENDNLKGKLGNVISNINTPQDQYRIDPSYMENFSNNENTHHRQKIKSKNLSSLTDNLAIEDLRSKNNSRITNNNNKYISNFKSNSDNDENDNNSSEDENENQNENYNKKNQFDKNILSNKIINKNIINSNKCKNYNYNSNNSNNNILNDKINNDMDSNYRKQETKHSREMSPNNIKWNRNLTLGKGSQSIINLNSANVSANNINNENHFITMHGNSSNLNSGELNHTYKVNPFVDNTSTFIQNDYDNIHDKISNMDQTENMDNTNLEEIDQFNGESYTGNNYHISEFPLQLKIKSKIKKANKI